MIGMSCECCDGKEKNIFTHEQTEFILTIITNREKPMINVEDSFRKAYWKPINFCPMCGRELRGEAE